LTFGADLALTGLVVRRKLLPALYALGRQNLNLLDLLWSEGLVAGRTGLTCAVGQALFAEHATADNGVLLDCEDIGASCAFARVVVVQPLQNSVIHWLAAVVAALQALSVARVKTLHADVLTHHKHFSTLSPPTETAVQKVVHSVILGLQVLHFALLSCREHCVATYAQDPHDIMHCHWG
jgi:hypothetical protein